MPGARGGGIILPLPLAVQRLWQRSLEGVVLIDGPGVVRGVAGRELLTGLLEASGVDMVLVLTGAGQVPPLTDELAGSVLELD